MITPTRKQLRQAYEMLRASPPFNGWGLPPGDEVVFQTERKATGRCRRLMGQHSCAAGRHRIFVASHRTLRGVIATLAHEMVHVYEQVAGLPDQYRLGVYIHGRPFRAAAEQVCKALDYPIARF